MHTMQKIKQQTQLLNLSKISKKTIVNALEGDLGNELYNLEIKKVCKKNQMILHLFKSDSYKLELLILISYCTLGMYACGNTQYPLSHL